jgi:hypothetical protein
MSIGYLTRYLPCQLLLAACAVAQSTTVLDNDWVRVISAYVEPHVRSEMHEHKFNRVMIFEQAGSQLILSTRKGPRRINFKAGEVMWNSGEGLHTVELVTPMPVLIVELEIKKPDNADPQPPRPLDPVKVDPKHYSVVMENFQVRVLRVNIGPHESTPLHQHALPRVVTYLTAQDFRVTDINHNVEMSKHNPGENIWGTAVTHKEENLSDQPFEAIITEFKN